MLNFFKTSDLMMNTNQILQNNTYNSKKIEHVTKQNDVEIFNMKNFFKEDYDELIILEQVAGAIIEDKKLISLLKITIRYITCLKEQTKLSMRKKKKRIFKNSKSVL